MPLQTVPRDISIKSSQNLDAFSKTRVSQLTTQAFIDFRYGRLDEANRIDTSISGDGQFSYGTANRALEIGRVAVTTTTNVAVGVPILVHIKAGISLKSYISFKINNSSLLTATSSAIYVGVGDYQQFYQLDKGFIGLVVNNGAYSVKVVQTDISGSTATGTYNRSTWLDPMDGTGPSGITLDFTKVQILFIKQQSGRSGYTTIGFVVGGKEIAAVNISFTNTALSLPLSTTGNVISTFGPCAGISTSATGTAGTVLTLYNAVSMTEDSGQDVLPTYQFSHSTVTSSIPSGSFKRIVTYRLNPAGDSSFFTKIILSELEIMSTGNDGFYWELRYRETGSTSGTWTAINSNSNLEYNTNNTGTSGFATVITGGFVNAGQKQTTLLSEAIANCYPIQGNDAYQTNVHRTISLWIKPFSTSTSSVATMTYKEIK